MNDHSTTFKLRWGGILQNNLPIMSVKVMKIKNKKLSRLKGIKKTWQLNDIVKDLTGTIGEIQMGSED